MMAQDQGDMIMEGSDLLKPIASNKDKGGLTDDGEEIDEDYRVFLVKLGVLADVGKGKKVGKGSKRILDPDEELRQEWLTMEKAMNAADNDDEIEGGDPLTPDKALYDEEIEGGDPLTPEKALSAEDSDVQADAGEFEARKGVDADKGEIGSDGEEDDYDPDYMVFVQHLKPHKTAYVLEIGRGKDVKIVRYEEEGLSSDERKRKVPNPVGRPPKARRSDGLHREMANLEIGRGQLKRDRKGERDRKVPKPVGRPPKARRSNSLHSKVKRGKVERLQITYNSKMDKDYYMFLRGLIISANNLVYEGKDGDEYRYDESSGSASDSDSEASPKPPPSVVRTTPEPINKKLVPSGKRAPSNKRVGKDGVEYIYDESAECVSDSDSEASPKAPPSRGRTTSGPSNRRLVPSGKRAPSNKRVGKDGVEHIYDESAESASDSDREASPKPPPSRGRTMSKPSSRSLVPSGNRAPSNKSVGEDGIQCRSDGSVKSESDSDREGSPPSIIDRMTPEPSNKSLVQSGKSVEDEFRQGAMDILLKPYNKKEHADLLEQVRLRKPIMRSHETRSRCVQYPDEKMMGRSYLDHHPDLKKKIKAVQRDEPHKALHLLRGFFFYNERVCMENPFKPWNDDSWLEAMNRSTSGRSGKHD